MCNHIFKEASRMLDCPIRIAPSCHPEAHVDVYANPKTRTFTLCCTRCEHPIATINARGKLKQHRKKARK